MIEVVHIDVCAKAGVRSIYAAGWGRQLVQLAASGVRQ